MKYIFVTVAIILLAALPLRAQQAPPAPDNQHGNLQSMPRHPNQAAAQHWRGNPRRGFQREDRRDDRYERRDGRRETQSWRVPPVWAWVQYWRWVWRWNHNGWRHERVPEWRQEQRGGRGH
jgi:hypothetical protein